MKMIDWIESVRGLVWHKHEIRNPLEDPTECPLEDPAVQFAALLKRWYWIEAIAEAYISDWSVAQVVGSAEPTYL